MNFLCGTDHPRHCLKVVCLKPRSPLIFRHLSDKGSREFSLHLSSCSSYPFHIPCGQCLCPSSGHVVPFDGEIINPFLETAMRETRSSPSGQGPCSESANRHEKNSLSSLSPEPYRWPVGARQLLKSPSYLQGCRLPLILILDLPPSTQTPRFFCKGTWCQSELSNRDCGG